MVFSSLLYLGAFLPAALLAYFAARSRTGRNGVLLAFSLLFYFVGEPGHLAVMLASILLNYLSALMISRLHPDRRRARKALLGLSVACNLGLLVFYKYTGFLTENLNRLFSLGLPVPEILMPIGISFFTFQGMSYVIDVYRGQPAQRSPLLVATYISLFPQLVAGPIVRYETIAAELSSRRETLPEAAQGLRRFCYGLGKKMLLSNPLGELAAAIFALDGAYRSTALAWLGAAAYALQIFYDFSGYSDMAIGLGQVFGFHFLENFDYPYISRSVTEFWRRWHISLSTWFRDYVYIPLGGNRRGLPRQLLNLLVVWTLTGLWHGAQWNFVFWGLYYGALLILEKLFLKRWLDRAPALLGHLYTLLCVLVGWVLFNSASMGDAWTYAARMFVFAPNTQAAGNSAIWYLWQYKAELALGVLFALPIAPKISARMQGKSWWPFIQNAAALALLWASVCAVVGTSFNPFIYFRF